MSSLRKLSNLILFYFFIFISAFKDSKNADILIDISDHRNHRYLYLIVIIFTLSNLKVDLRIRRRSIRSIRRCSISRKLTSVKDVRFIFLPKKSYTLVITDHSFQNYNKGRTILISTNYYRDDSRTDEFRLPILMHPNFYHSGLWDEKLDNGRHRQNAIILYGAFSAELYNNKAIEQFFNVRTRRSSYEKVIRKTKHRFIKNLKEIEHGQFQNEIVVVDSDVVRIPEKKLRSIISRFKYQLCLPGVEYPPCHNLVECLSTGTVPILSKQYNESLSVSLTNNVNAFIYSSDDTLLTFLDSFFYETTAKIEAIQNKAKTFYRENYEPGSISKKILSDQSIRIISTLGNIKDCDITNTPS